MITLHRSKDRHYVRNGSQEIWMTFSPGNPGDPTRKGFRGLESFNDIKLAPGSELKVQPEEGQEILTYVQVGNLVLCQEKAGEEILRPGYYHRTGSNLPLTSRVTSGPDVPGAHVFVSYMTPPRQEGQIPTERRHIPFSSRRGVLRLIASPEGSESSLRVRQDVRVYSSILDQGCHLVHELRKYRAAWLHVLIGRVRLVDQTLEAGDGASLEDEMAVSLTAQGTSEILLFDLP